MDNDFKTTFIPKKSTSGRRSVAPTQTARRTQSLVGLLAILLVVTSLVSMVGVFIYRASLVSSVNSKIESINRAESAFEPEKIVELRKLDIRLRAATELLDQHVAVSDFFDSLAESTLPDVQFSGMTIDFSEQSPSVSTSGEARGYLELAQQSDLFEANRYIQNPIFSDFSRTETDRITFNLSFSINPELLVFGRTLRNAELQDGFAGEVGTGTDSEAPIRVEDRIIEDQRQVVPTGIPVEFN